MSTIPITPALTVVPLPPPFLPPGLSVGGESGSVGGGESMQPPGQAHFVVKSNFCSQEKY